MATIINRKSNDRKYTVKYSVIHSLYWSIFCSSCSFAAVFLLAKHFTNSQIGVVLAAANILAVFLQPAVAAFSDATKKISMKNLTALLVGMAGAATAARYFVPARFGVLATMFILELTILFTLQPLVNSLGMNLINRGVSINFGLARGLGSLAFAVLSLFLGTLVDRCGPDSLTVVSFALYAGLAVSVFTFTGNSSGQALSPSDRAENPLSKPTGNLAAFALQHKKFSVLIIAVALTFSSHTMINNYMIQIMKNMGGNATNMGIATGIAAAIELPTMVFFGYLVKKVRCSSIIKFSLLFFLIKTVLTLLANSVWMIYAAQLFQCCSYALFIPASIYYVNMIIPHDDLAKGQAFMTSAITLGGVGASLVGGLLLDGSGVRGMLIAGSVAAALGLVIGLFTTEKTSLNHPAADPEKTD